MTSAATPSAPGGPAGRPVPDTDDLRILAELINNVRIPLAQAAWNARMSTAEAAARLITMAERGMPLRLVAEGDRQTLWRIAQAGPATSGVPLPAGARPGPPAPAPGPRSVPGPQAPGYAAGPGPQPASAGTYAPSAPPARPVPIPGAPLPGPMPSGPGLPPGPPGSGGNPVVPPIPLIPPVPPVPPHEQAIAGAVPLGGPPFGPPRPEPSPPSPSPVTTETAGAPGPGESAPDLPTPASGVPAVAAVQEQEPSAEPAVPAEPASPAPPRADPAPAPVARAYVAPHGLLAHFVSPSAVAEPAQEPEPAPEPEPSPGPEPYPAQSTTGLSGERLTVALREVIDPADERVLAVGYQLDEGERAVLVCTGISNAGPAEYPAWPDLYLTLRTRGGERIEKAPLSVSGYPGHRVGIEPGQESVGWTMFLLPNYQDVTAVVWAVRPDLEQQTLSWPINPPAAPAAPAPDQPGTGW